MGTPQSGFIDVNTEPALQQRAWSVFVQDDIRLTPKLKVNVGLRWDYLAPITDRFNALSRGFDFTSASPLKAPGLDLKGGLLFAGAGGSRGIFKRDWNNFGPRLGFAYNIASKTVLRGGYGLIYAPSYDDPGPAPGFSQSTAMVTSIQTGVPQNTLTNPFPSGILRPVGSSLGLATYLGQGFSFPNPDRVDSLDAPVLLRDPARVAGAVPDQRRLRGQPHARAGGVERHQRDSAEQLRARLDGAHGRT